MRGFPSLWCAKAKDQHRAVLQRVMRVWKMCDESMVECPKGMKMIVRQWASMALILVLGSFPTTGTPRHNTHYTQLYPHPHPCSCTYYVLLPRNIYASSHKSALLHPVPAKLTQSLLRIRILPGKTTTPYHPIQVSHDVVHSCFSMLSDNTACALHLSEVCPSPLSTWACTLKRLVNACTPISGVIDSILVELQQDQQTCCKLIFIR